MLQLTPHINILVSKEPISFRTRFDGTAAICRNIHQKNPYDGSLFVFINSRRTMIRCYMFNGLGEWLCDFRIAEGKFKHWVRKDEPLSTIQAHELYLLLCGGNPNGIEVPPSWRKIC